METVFIVHSDYLAHHGIKNQRWGQRRFQNYDGSLTDEGRKRYGIGVDKRTNKEKRAAAKEKAKREKEKIRRDKAQDKKDTAIAEKVVKDRQKKMDYLRDHPQEMYKYRKELTNDDVKQIMEKVEFDKKLKAIQKAETDAGWKKIEDIRSRVQTGVNLYITSKNAYNATAEVMNALSDMEIISGVPHMPKWGENKSEYLIKENEKKFAKNLNEESTLKDIYEHPENYTTRQHEMAAERMRKTNSTRDLWEGRNERKWDDATLKDMYEHPENYTSSEHRAAVNRANAEASYRDMYETRNGMKKGNSKFNRNNIDKKISDFSNKSGYKDFKDLFETDPERAFQEYPEFAEAIRGIIFNN